MKTSNETPSELLATLRDLEAASRELGGRALTSLYNERGEQVSALTRLRLWCWSSATQGNITEAGAAALWG